MKWKRVIEESSTTGLDYSSKSPSNIHSHKVYISCGETNLSFNAIAMQSCS